MQSLFCRSMSDEISDRRPGCWGFIKIVRDLLVHDISEDRPVCVIRCRCVVVQAGVVRHSPGVRDAFLAVCADPSVVLCQLASNV